MDESKLPPLIDLSALRRNAEGATPGEWYVDTDPRPGMSWNRSIDTDWKHGHTVCHMTHSDGKHAHRDEATAAHIAGNSPDVTLALLDVVEKAQPSPTSRLYWCGAEEWDEILSELDGCKEGYSPDIDAMQRAVLADLVRHFTSLRESLSRFTASDGGRDA